MIESVSIPNGMEFYSELKAYADDIATFQFPTGWNSTKSRPHYGEKTDLVSIPNGMEFYAFRGGLLRTLSPVSIPNGMEFYAAKARGCIS